MCRIHGYVGADVPTAVFDRVAATQRHGGPDATSRLVGNRWGLGNNRLAVTAPADGAQPYVLGPIAVVFNGEIYNHRELRGLLRGRGCHVAAQCDGAILPALYAEFGQGFVQLLDGMYAIAIIDARSEPRLHLYTDPVGMKSLYYSWQPSSRSFHFASEIASLLSFGTVDRTLAADGLDEFLSSKVRFGGDTMLADVKKLPPATVAVVSAASGLSIRRWSATEVGVRNIGTADAGRWLRAELDSAVERLLHADVPTCVITSGGLDSSLVTAMSARHTSDLHTFTVTYRGDWPGDERHFARGVAELVGSTHHEVEIDPFTMPDLLPYVVAHLGEPNADPIALSSYALFEGVHDAGFTVALTGDGADEQLLGYDRIIAALSGEAGWRAPYGASLAGVPTALRQRLYSPDYRRYLAAGSSYGRDLAIALHRPASRRQTIHDIEFGLRLPAYHLRRVDHMSMAHAVEARLPFCQRNFIDAATSLPTSALIAGGRGKQALNASAEGLLPRSVLERPKQPFTLPINALLRTGTPLMQYAEDVLTSDLVGYHGLLDVAAVRAVLAAQQANPAEDLALTIWSLLVFHVWLELFGVHSTPLAGSPGVTFYEASQFLGWSA
jgi:asparagine synthase (glutamine-hydrolysing)